MLPVNNGKEQGGMLIFCGYTATPFTGRINFLAQLPSAFIASFAFHAKNILLT